MKQVVKGRFRLLRIYHDISMNFRRLDVQIVHWADLIGKLLVHRLCGSPPFTDIPLESAGKTRFGIAFDEDAEIEQCAQWLVLQDQYAIDQYDGPRFGPLGFQFRHMGGKIIKRPVDRFAFSQLGQLRA